MALADALLTALRPTLGDDALAVEGLRRLSGGASRETWSFTATGPQAGARDLVLQRLRPGGSATGPSMAVEDRLLTAAAQAGVPVPPVVVDAPAAEAAGLGAARVSAHVAGETLGPRLVRAERTDEGRRTLARQLGAALAGIHAIDPATVPELEAVDPLARVRDGLDLVGEARPALELGLRRLTATRPPAGATGVVHGDFRIGNLLIEGDHLTAVLDWELAHRGEVAEDLGWLCGRAWCFGGDREVGGVADLDDLLAGYTDAGGRPVTPEAVRWWTAAGTLLWGLICAVQARRHLDGHVRSVELATIGRRVCEAEYDLLDLVLDPTGRAAPSGRVDRTSEDHGDQAEGSDPHPPATVADPGSEPTRASETRPGEATWGSRDGLHGRPTAAELVDAVRSHLADEVGPALEGSARFHARVAAHALEVVERELRLGPSQREAHARRLAALGVADEAELAAIIRVGDLDGRSDVEAAVRAAVVDRLRVANPDWLHPTDA